MFTKINILLLSICILIFQAGFASTVLASDCPDNSSFDDLSQSCQCNSGYLLENSQCVKPSQYCADSFGANSKYDFSTGKCACVYGYIAYSGQCVNANIYCQNNNGAHSAYDFSTKACKCEFGYLQDVSGYCVSTAEYCADMYGDNSHYNKPTKTCECDLGYKLNNSKCLAIAILNISSSNGFIGDLVKITGKNLGDNASEQKLYVGTNLVNSSDISEWTDNEIIFEIGDNLDSGGVVMIKTADGVSISGPNLTVSAKPVAKTTTSDSSDSGKITLNQQINIAGSGATAQPNDNSSTGTTTTSVAVNPSQQTSGGGLISGASSFFGGLFNGFKNFFISIFS